MQKIIKNAVEKLGVQRGGEEKIKDFRSRTWGKKKKTELLEMSFAKLTRGEKKKKGKRASFGESVKLHFHETCGKDRHPLLLTGG